MKTHMETQNGKADDEGEQAVKGWAQGKTSTNQGTPKGQGENLWVCMLYFDLGQVAKLLA